MEKYKMFIYKEESANDLPLPHYKTDGAAGMDLYAAVEKEGLTLKPGERILVPTGIKIQLESELEAQIRPRSGLAVNYGITLLNSPGTIDSDYRGEIKVIVINHGSEEFKIERGMRIAQLIVSKVIKPNIEIVEDEKELEKSVRGKGGFGHTGEKN
ncbi:dUTP diphosphatase [Natranaerofaba carboxydovora]|uniref:dUTP diphosphatase n=1 Tax=Natranaerofaba carboxydovora TaxID=2742683 RepID=UPI001F143EC8|nr:dUTP diphosphatase [Natranaerofaba carboxydovora]